MNKKIGKNIQVLRTNYGISQAKLAALLSYEGPETVCRWEKGEREPKIDSLAKLAGIFKVNIDELINSDMSLNPTIIRSLEHLSKDKLTNLICDFDLPICDLDVMVVLDQIEESVFNNEDINVEEMLIKCTRDFGAAYSLDKHRKLISSTEIDKEIEKLYTLAYQDGNGIVEAGINLTRSWIIQDINARRENKKAVHSKDIFDLLWNIEDSVCCSLVLPIIDFYKALMKVCWLYLDNYTEDSEYIEGAQEFVNYGYQEMAILAEEERNPYALEFLSKVSSDIADDVREKLRSMTLDEYLGCDMDSLSEEDKALMEEFKKAEEWHAAIDEAMGL